jgi:hypothetical protein
MILCCESWLSDGEVERKVGDVFESSAYDHMHVGTTMDFDGVSPVESGEEAAGRIDFSHVTLKDGGVLSGWWGKDSPPTGQV